MSMVVTNVSVVGVRKHRPLQNIRKHGGPLQPVPVVARALRPRAGLQGCTRAAGRRRGPAKVGFRVLHV